ncbi:TPA: thiol:disulfide interchange protein DsbG [Stenotrophomonas maltophilia]|uniref:thiol:disulfide interchange protein DsbG n=1 Tax=Stenotrophomonas forensis TaxID=2871169 RepID=UPI0038C40014
MKPSLFVSSALLALSALMATGCSGAAEPQEPKVLRAISSQGVEVVDEFPAGAGAGVRAYAGSASGNPLAIYVLNDGTAIVGTRIGSDGKVLDQDTLTRLVAEPAAKSTMAKLEQSSWIQDGSKTAPKVIYVFTDANCPYCHQFWQATRPWVDAGKVQLRHIMVGVIREDSAGKAAFIMSAQDPAAAFRQNESAGPRGSAKALASIPPRIKQELALNEQLMTSLGFQGTPAIISLVPGGGLQKINGMPRGDALAGLLGPR